ncbi:hypothetical protein [Actinoplanes couchii]|uniref:Uncharacterized protein n=1 Tax=Actinoplanes couchii TaxID=403638 RepID=A0ABQ3X5T0_9ACTN|nr:hypothetical protein [Actinoplanes couchii]MDR6325419.1 hypothetical protein [Actinoplanes couchii]GID53878.1 hypothetical protein Aco03nite_022820 [Actinoplanes couchii]
MTIRDRQPIGRDYQLMVSALADVTKRRDAALDDAELAYQDSAARAAGELARAESDALAADRWAGAAAAQVIDVDREATRLWDQLRRARGLRIRALGEVPEPAPVEAMPRVALQRRPEPGEDVVAPGRQSPRVLLSRAADRIDVTIHPPGPGRLPRWALLLLPVTGAAGAALASLVAVGLVTFGDTATWGGPLIRGLGWLGFAIAPSVGVPVAAYLTHSRLHARMEIGGIGLTLLGGMVAATLLSLSFATTR